MRNFLLEELADALDDRSGQFRYYFLPSTGKVAPYAMDDAALAAVTGRADAILIQPISHADAHALVLDFIETLADGELALRLREASSGVATPARFLQVLGAYPRARRSWLSFRQRRLEAMALDWLRQREVDLVRLGLDKPLRPLEEAIDFRFDAGLEPALDELQKRIAAQPLGGRPWLEEKLRDLRCEEVYHSNAIRGNRLTRDQSTELLKRGTCVGGLSLREHLEVVNLDKAIEHARTLGQSPAPLTERAIRELHALLYAGIDDERAGIYRHSDSRIVGRDYLPPESALVPALVRECTEWLEETDADAVAKATAIQARILSIAPFDDGNGRVGRLLTNVVLQSAGYPPAIIRAEDREAYYDGLRHADEGTLTALLALNIESVKRALDYLERES